MNYENEQKYRVTNVSALRKRLSLLMANKISAQQESNQIFDRQGQLRSGGCLLRLRHHGKQAAVLTYKGPLIRARHKKRLEIETAVDFSAMKQILKQLGFKKAAGYQKKRTEYRLGKNHLTLDYLPRVGWFLEIEGSDRDIQRLSKKLGLSKADQEKRNYLALSLQGHESYESSPR